MNGKPAISAVVCTYDRYDLLAEAIASLQAQTLSPERFDIIIVDNGPNAEQSEERRATYESIPNLRWFWESTPGLSNARNRGVAESEADLIAFLDDDALAAPDWLEATLRAFDELPPTDGVLGGRILPRWTVPRPGWLSDGLLIYLSVIDWPGDIARPIADNEWIAGANIIFRRSLLNDLGGFDVNLGRTGGAQILLGNEEKEMIERCRVAGSRCIYDPRVVVQHLVDPSRLSQEWFRRRVVWQAVSDYISDSEAAFEAGPMAWKRTTDFFAQLPPMDRTPRGFLVRQADSGMFHWQLGALYDYITSSLSGFHGVE